MTPAKAPAPTVLLLVSACLLTADVLPHWQKLWFVAESGHFGGSADFSLLLILGLYARWRPALRLTQLLLVVQLVFIGLILLHNIPAGGPILGFCLVGALRLTALAVLSYLPAVQRHFRGRLLPR